MIAARRLRESGQGISNVRPKVAKVGRGVTWLPKPSLFAYVVPPKLEIVAQDSACCQQVGTGACGYPEQENCPAHHLQMVPRVTGLFYCPSLRQHGSVLRLNVTAKEVVQELLREPGGLQNLKHCCDPSGELPGRSRVPLPAGLGKALLGQFEAESKQVTIE